MVSIKLLLAGVEVFLVLCFGLTIWSSFVWIRTYLKNRLDMQNSLYDSTCTQEDFERLEELEDESKRRIQFYIAFSILIVVVLFVLAMIMNAL